MKIMMINDKQKKLMTKLFNRTGLTFQTLAREAGLVNVPDHLNELTFNDAQRLIETHSGWLRHD